MLSNSNIAQTPKFNSRKITDLWTDAGRAHNYRLVKEQRLLNSSCLNIFETIQHYAGLGHKVCFASQQRIAEDANCSRSYVNRILKKLCQTMVNGKPLVKSIARRNKDNGNYTNLILPLNLTTGTYAEADRALLLGRDKTQHYSNASSEKLAKWRQKKGIRTPGKGLLPKEILSEMGVVPMVGTNKERDLYIRTNSMNTPPPGDAFPADDKATPLDYGESDEVHGAKAPFVDFSNIQQVKEEVELSANPAAESLPIEEESATQEVVERSCYACPFNAVSNKDFVSDKGYEDLDDDLFLPLLKEGLPLHLLGILKSKATRCKRTPIQIREAVLLTIIASEKSEKKWPLVTFAMNALQMGDPLQEPKRPTPMPKLPKEKPKPPDEKHTPYLVPKPAQSERTYKSPQDFNLSNLQLQKVSKWPQRSQAAVAEPKERLPATTGNAVFCNTQENREVFKVKNIGDSAANRLAQVAVKYKRSAEYVADVVQCLIDCKSDITSPICFIQKGLEKGNYKPNLPRVKGMAPLKEHLSTYESKVLKQLADFGFIGGYGLMFSECGTKLRLYQGDQYFQEMKSQWNLNSVCFRRNVLLVMSKMYLHYRKIVQKNGVYLNQYGKELKLLDPPPNVVAMLNDTKGAHLDCGMQTLLAEKI